MEPNRCRRDGQLKGNTTRPGAVCNQGHVRRWAGVEDLSACHTNSVCWELYQCQSPNPIYPAAICLARWARGVAAAGLPLSSEAQSTAASTAQPVADPTTKYPKPPYTSPFQPWPGLASKMTPPPDHGETSYKGSGRLLDRKALITGGRLWHGPRGRDCVCAGRCGCRDQLPACRGT